MSKRQSGRVLDNILTEIISEFYKKTGMDRGDSYISRMILNHDTTKEELKKLINEVAKVIVDFFYLESFEDMSEICFLW